MRGNKEGEAPNVTANAQARRGCGRGEGRRGERCAVAVRLRGEVLRGGEALGTQPDRMARSDFG